MPTVAERIKPNPSSTSSEMSFYNIDFSGSVSFGQTVVAGIDRSIDILSNITVTTRLTLCNPEYEIIDSPKFLVHTTEPIDVLVSDGRLTTKIYKKNLPPGMFYGPLGTSNKKVSYLLAIDNLYDYTDTLNVRKKHPIRISLLYKCPRGVLSSHRQA